MDRAPCRANQPADRTDESGFSRAVRAEQCEDLPAPDGQVDIVERLDPTLVGLRQAANVEDGIGHRAELGDAWQLCKSASDVLFMRNDTASLNDHISKIRPRR